MVVGRVPVEKEGLLQRCTMEAMELGGLGKTEAAIGALPLGSEVHSCAWEAKGASGERKCVLF